MSPADAALPSPFDSPALRQALGRFATGVTIVTCLDAERQPLGLTVSSFNALSLLPPLVLWSLRTESPNALAFSAAEHFAVNVLAADQVALSRRFASQTRDRFDGVAWQPAPAGPPLLEGAAAQFVCARESQQRAGDHLLFIGRVLSLRALAVAPLVYHGGHYHGLGERL